MYKKVFRQEKYFDLKIILTFTTNFTCYVTS